MPNPNYRGQEFLAPVRQTVLDSRQGIQAQWSQLAASGLWKVRALLFALANGWMQETAQAWATAHREELKSMDATQVKVKALSLAREEGASFGPTPTETDLALINDMALEPMTADQIYVRKIRLANDRVDRDFERFSRGVLNKFSDTLPGKSVLIGHEHHSAPIGRFYDAKVARDKATGTAWLEGKWYAPITAQNEHDRKSIDAGVWSYTSIGFMWDAVECDICKQDYRSMKCSHLLGTDYPVDQVSGDMPPIASDSGKTVTATATYKGDAQAVEGSIVYLGAQYDAAIVKAKLAGDFAAEKRALLEKGACGDTNLPMAPMDMAWSFSGADGNAVLGEPPDWSRYAKAHFWQDPAQKEAKGGYKLPFAKMMDGGLKMVWGGVHAALGRLPQAQIPDADKAAVMGKISAAYKRFGKEMPKNYTSVDGVVKACEPLAAGLDWSDIEGFVFKTGTDIPGADGAADHPSGNDPAEDGDMHMGMTEEEKAAFDEAKSLSDAATAKVAELNAAATEVAERVKALRAPLVAEVEKLGLMLKRDTELAAFKAAHGEDLALMPDEALINLRDGWIKALDERAPGGRQTTPDDANAPVTKAPLINVSV